MNIITQLFGDGAIQAIGWTILHSLWQGMAIALLLSIVMLALRKKSSQARYIAGLSGLFFLFVVVAFTFVSVYSANQQALQTEYSFAEMEEGSDLVEGDLLLLELAEEQRAMEKQSSNIYLQLFQGYFDNHLPLIVLIWIIGVFVMTLRLLGELAYIQHLRHYRGRQAGERWQNLLNEIAQKMGIDKKVQLKETLRISGPMLAGYIKPIILLPVGLLSSLTPKQVESILAHELAHIKRHDYLINIIQSMIETLLFFNPAVWWMSSFIRTEREHCCDEAAIALTGDEITFVKTLAQLEEWRNANANLALAFTGQYGVLGRIQRILNGDNAAQLSLKVFWSTAVLLVFFFSLAFNLHQTALASTPQYNSDFVTELTEQEEQDTFPEPADVVEMEEGGYSDIADGPDFADFVEIDESEPETSDAVEPDYYDHYSEIIPDSIPAELGQMEEKIHKMNQDHRKQMMALEQEAREIEMQKMRLEGEVQKMHIGQQRKMLEMEKRAQELQRQQTLREQEVHIRETEVREQALELEGQLTELEGQKMELELSDKDEDEEKIAVLEKKARELQAQMMQKEREVQKMELQLRKEELELEKKAHALESENSMQERDIELQVSNIQEQMLNLEIKIQELEGRRSILENEFELKIMEMQRELQEKMEQYERSGRREE